MKRIPYQPVVIAEHMRGCTALREYRRKYWRTPWAFVREFVYRDAIGRKTRKPFTGDRWWLIGCNCVGCPAEIIVNERSFLEKLPPGRERKR